jgi:iron complex transport system substrate-binding protein
MTEPHIVTLLASATEIVCALGFENALVARSHECDYPVSVTTLPACTESKIDTQKPSREIDDQVKSIVEQGLSVYRVNGDLLQQLQPDVIVTQTQCEVCAASPKDLDRAVSDWTGAAPRIVSLEPNGLADVWTDIQNVAEALGAPDRGERLVAELKARMGAIKAEAGQSGHRPRVACIEWIDPLMAAGNWMPELVEMAGGENIFGEAGRHSPWMTLEDLCEADPEVILILPCGYDIKEARRNMPALTGQPEWPDLSAVTTSRVYIADGNQYFNRPGPRLAESLEILAELLHPELFDFGHQGIGWERL